MAALFGAIFTFTDMAVVDVLTNGGPNNATQVLTSWAFFRGIDGGDVGPGRGDRAVPVPAAARRGDRDPAGGAPDGGPLMTESGPTTLEVTDAVRRHYVMDRSRRRRTPPSWRRW